MIEKCGNCDCEREIVIDPCDGPVVLPCLECGDDEIIVIERELVVEQLGIG